MQSFERSSIDIAKEKVTSQQQLLTEITDILIILLHLVADLQSSSEDKFLIAKIQRELESEITSLTFLKEKYDKDEELWKSTIRDKTNKLENVTQSFLNKMKNDEIKTKFLQKALTHLSQKYFKFTPLIFVSNFVYAYSKFTKQFKDEEVKLHERLSIYIDEILSSKIQASTEIDNESQDMIKLVKTETKAKYLEDQVHTLNQKNTALHAEIDEMRLSIVKESKHWNTIEALFGRDHSAEIIEQEVQTEAVELIDSNTNTEQDNQNQEEVKILPKVDKNLSPLSSPVKALS